MKNIKLEGLLTEGEVVATYTCTKSIREYHAIADPNSDDVGAMLEDTLHRIIEAGGDADDLWFLMGVEDYDEALTCDPEMGAYGEYIHIDLGYVIPDLVMTWNA